MSGRSEDAYDESRDRRPSKREAVLSRLLLTMGEWVPGHKLEPVGGTEATRRVRELRRWLRKREPFTHDIECARIDGAWSYRIVQVRDKEAD